MANICPADRVRYSGDTDWDRVTRLGTVGATDMSHWNTNEERVVHSLYTMTIDTEI